MTRTFTPDEVLTRRDDAARAYFDKVPSVEEARTIMANHQGVTELKPLGKPCYDCAVVDGFYEPFSAVLSLLPEHEITRRSSEWYCHNNCGRACAGNIEYQRAIAHARASIRESGTRPTGEPGVTSPPAPEASGPVGRDSSTHGEQN